MLADKLNDCRVDITRTSTHDEALERGHTHGGVHALAADRGRNRSAVAEVAHNDLCVLRVKISLANHLTCDKVVTGAVEAVATNPVLLIVLIGQRIEICLLLHAHAESRVKDSNIRRSGHSRLAGFNAHEVCRIVEGSQMAVRNCLLDVLINQDGRAVKRSAVNHTMSDCGNLIRALNHTVVGIDKSLHDKLNRLLVSRHSDLELILLAARRRMCEQRALDSDSLAETLREHTLILHIDQLILERRASAVHDKNFHCVFPPSTL